MGTVIRGRVLDQNGQPMAGARVYFRSGPGVHPDIAGLTSEAGDFALFAPNPGTYVIESVADGYEPTMVSAEAGDAGEIQVDLQLEEPR